MGPRGTGKSYYIRNQLKNIHTINLLKSSEYLPLSNNPSLLEEIINSHVGKIIAIDEIQKIPSLMDEAHRLIEEKNIRFLLTGSSARKLKADGVNLLAGRAWLARMFPFNWIELERPSIKKILNIGTLPSVWLSQDSEEELDNYIQTYIQAELKAEGIIRKIPAFTRFLKTAALCSGELLNYENISSDSGVPASTVKEHFSILEDTMIGYTLDSWRESRKRKAITAGKFYFFDPGVLNYIAGVKVENENTPLFGNRFEHFIINEARCANYYQRRKYNINYWRSTSQFEVDLIFGKTAIEIKSTRNATEKHFNGLKALKEEGAFKKYLFVSQDSQERTHEGIQAMHYSKFLDRLWAGDF